MERKSVMLNISTRQYEESLQPSDKAFERVLTLEDSTDLMTEGFFYTKGDASYIIYDEADEDANRPLKVVLKADGKSLNVKRFDDSGRNMLDLMLNEGSTEITEYKFPFGSVSIEVYTNKILNEIEKNGTGKIFADYRIKIADNNKRNKINIEVNPE